MKRLSMILVLLAALGFLWGTAQAAEVVQGKCINYDADGKKVVLEEYDINFTREAPYGNPTGILFEGDLRKAKVGIKPEPGDILRVAYKVDGESKQVLKVMNVSKQNLKEK